MKITSPLSIGIPVFNQQETIGETVESVLRQSLAPAEIVVSDNHSTDGTSEILRGFGSRIRLVRPLEHQGMAANWNFCVRQTRGEWVALLSGDDLAKPEYVRSFTRTAEEHPEAVFLMAGWENIDAGGRVLEQRYLLSTPRVARPPESAAMQLRGPKGSFASFAFRRDAFEKVGGYAEDFHLIQDWIFQFRMGMVGEVVTIDQLVAQYRCHERPELAAKRLPLAFADEYHYLADVAWEAESCGVPREEIREACRARFLRLLLGLLEKPWSLGEPEITKLQDLAAQLGMQSELDRYFRGNLKPGLRERLVSQLRAHARPLVLGIRKFLPK